MRVARGEQEASQAHELRVLDDGLHQPFPEPLATMLLQHVDVAQIRERRAIAVHPGEAHLARRARPRPRSPKQSDPWIERTNTPVPARIAF